MKKPETYRMFIKRSVAYPGIEKSYCNLVSTLNNNKMISIGNIIRKGYHNLIEALRNIDGDWELNIVGNEKLMANII